MQQQIKELLDAGVHFGHKTSKWCPKMKPFVWGSKNKVYFIDVAKTAFLLDQACQQIRNIAANGGKLLWVGTKVAAHKAIKNAGAELDMPIVYHRWIGGSLTNFDQVRKGVSRLLHLQDIIKKPMANLKKKEIVRLKKEMERLDKNFGGIVNLRYPPAAMVVVDVRKEVTAIKEAVVCGVPIIGIADTNSDPSSLTITIPANDNSEKSISCIVDKMVAAAKEGLEQLKQKRAQDKETSKSSTEKMLDQETKHAKSRGRAEESKKAVAVEQETPVQVAEAPVVPADSETVESETTESKE